LEKHSGIAIPIYAYPANNPCLTGVQSLVPMTYVSHDCGNGSSPGSFADAFAVVYKVRICDVPNA